MLTSEGVLLFCYVRMPVHAFDTSPDAFVLRYDMPSKMSLPLHGAVSLCRLNRNQQSCCIAKNEVLLASHWDHQQARRRLLPLPAHVPATPPPHPPLQVVTLYFNRSRVGVFSTYMVVENLANPADFKVRFFFHLD